MNFPSQLVENAVHEVSKLPGIGKKSALRIVMHLLKQNHDFTDTLSHSLKHLRENIKYCQKLRDYLFWVVVKTPQNTKKIAATIEEYYV